MRTTSLVLGGIAGFAGLIEATFFWFVGSILGDGTPYGMAVLALLGLVGAVLAKHRPRACALLESVAGVGLLADGHPILGGAFAAAAVLCLAGLKTSPLPDRTEDPVRGDLASAFTVLGMAGLAIVAGVGLPVVGLLVLGLALSGGDGGGVLPALTLTITIAIVLGFALLVMRAVPRRKSSLKRPSRLPRHPRENARTASRARPTGRTPWPAAISTGGSASP